MVGGQGTGRVTDKWIPPFTFFFFFNQRGSLGLLQKLDRHFTLGERGRVEKQNFQPYVSALSKRKNSVPLGKKQNIKQTKMLQGKVAP